MRKNWRARQFPRLEVLGAGAALLALTMVTPGCRLVRTTAEVPGNVVRTMGGGKGAKPPPDPVLLQQELFRFADEFIAEANQEYARLLKEWPDAPELRLLEAQLNLNYRFVEIASGPNSFANLVDMVFAVVLARHQVEIYGLADEPGEIARPAVVMLKEYERQIIAVARDALGEEQQALLRANIKAWIDANITRTSGLYARYSGPISELLGKGAAQRPEEATNLLGVLMLDPLAGLDPTVREIAQTRLFAERAMYVAQRMPKILNMEIELLKRRTLVTPEVARLLEDLNNVSRSVERISATVAELPDRLQAEREALVKTLHEEREGLTVLVQETRGALDAGSRAMENLNTVVLSTDAFLGHLGVHEKPEREAGAGTTEGLAAPPVGPPEPAAPSEPFRIQDYTAAAAQLAETAERVNTLVTTLDRTLVTATSDEVAGKIDAASQSAVERGRDVVDHAFWRALVFLALACLMVLGTVLAYRLIRRRMRA